MKYTNEQIQEMTQLYAQASTEAERKEVVNVLAAKFNTSKQSVIGKLNTLKLYQKPQRLTKAGEVSTSKKEYVNAISILLGINTLSSLEKASKADLKRIADRLITMSEKVNLGG